MAWGEYEEVTDLKSFFYKYKYDEVNKRGIMLYEIALCDMDSDGVPELIAGFDNMGGCRIVFREENGEYFAADFLFRAFQRLWTSGVFSASGGAAYTFYYNLTFEENKFVVNEIARRDYNNQAGEFYYIGIEEADKERVELWKNENLSEPVKWYVHYDNGQWDLR